MEQLVNNIIRPPRAEYDPKNDLLDEEFMLKGKWYQRKDLEVKNIRGDVLKCSHYRPIIYPEGKPLPCVIYCHGNSGCRADASEAAIILLPSNITVFTLDFSGSGLSGGEHVTLGWNEKDDLKSVVEYLMQDGNISLIGLWGRSMGAVTSLMYGAQDPSIAGIVLDSPFSNLVDLMMEVADTNKIRLPKFTLKFAIQYMRRSVLKKAKFDITELDTVKVARCCFVPLLLGHAVDDDFIRPHHSDRIFDAYMGEKNIIKFEGDHNSPRPQVYFDSISIFFNNVLQPPEDDTFFDMPPDYFGKDIWSGVREVGYSGNLLTAPISLAVSSTEDAIKQLHAQRPISKAQIRSDISSMDEQSEAKQEGVVADPTPLSSNSISFELSNGDLYRPSVPASIDDDEYVEYPLDNLTDFTESMEEEDKMFMEAVKESLKDLEMRPSHAEELSSSNKQPESLQEYDFHDSAATKQCAPSNEPATPLITNGHDSASKLPVPDNKMSGPPNLILSAKEPENNGASPHRDTSVGDLSSASFDLVDHTKVTVTVIKNPTSNIIDGLLRRWDLNFFRK